MALPVSAQWKTAIGQQFRYPAALKFGIELAPPGLAESLVVATGDTNPVATQAKLDLRNPAAPTPFATLEPDRWLLNGKYDILSAGQKVDDWWSTPYSATATSKTIHCTFDKEYSMPGLWVQWDVINKTYPQSVTLVGFDNTHVQLFSQTISVTSSVGFIDYEMTDVQYVDIIINEWSVPNWFARINAFMFGLNIEFNSQEGDSRVSGATISRTTDLIGRELSTMGGEVKLHNYDQYFDPKMQQGISKFIVNKQKASFTLGFFTDQNTLEWMPNQTVYINDPTIPTGQQDVTIPFTTRYTFMDKEFLYSSYSATPRSFKTLALEILERGSIIKDSSNLTPWQLDPVLDTIQTSAILPVEAENVLLSYIAGATGCFLDMEAKTDSVRIRRSFNSTAYAITDSNTLDYPKIQLYDKVRKINIKAYKYFVETTAQKLSEGTYYLSGTVALNLKFSQQATDVTISVSGATEVSRVIYASCVVLVLNAGTGATVTVSISGKPIQSSSTDIVAYQDVSLTSGLEVSIDNPLITEISTFPEIVQSILRYFTARRTITQKYQGFPELEVGDTVSYNGEVLPISATAIEFNGAFKGDIQLN